MPGGTDLRRAVAVAVAVSLPRQLAMRQVGGRSLARVYPCPPETRLARYIGSHRSEYVEMPVLRLRSHLSGTLRAEP